MPLWGSVSSVAGITLLEVLIAALMGAMIAGGTMLAFTTAKKTSVRGAGVVEAADFAQQTIERFRNKIACDDPDWFSAATCATILPAPAWTADSLPGSPGSLSMIGQGGSRQYRVTPSDCDGDGTNGDCFQLDTKVAWSPRQ